VNRRYLFLVVLIGSFMPLAGPSEAAGPNVDACSGTPKRFEFADRSRVQSGEKLSYRKDRTLSVSDLYVPFSPPSGLVVVDELRFGATQLYVDKIPAKRRGSASIATRLRLSGVMLRRVCGQFRVETRSGRVEMPVFVYGGSMLFVSGRQEFLSFAQTVDTSVSGLRCWSGSLHVIDGTTVLIVDRLFRPWCQVTSTGDALIADDQLKDAGNRNYVPIEGGRSFLAASEVLHPAGSALLDSAVLIGSDNWFTSQNVLDKEAKSNAGLAQFEFTGSIHLIVCENVDGFDSFTELLRC
jgi:hypothetical protein